MSQELATTKSPEQMITPADVNKYICEKATEKEVHIFLQICKAYGLNPFKREIHLIKYSDSLPASIVVGYEVYLKRAERCGKWNGFECGTEGEGESMRAWVKIYRKDWSHPLSHEVYFEEYKQTKKIWQNGKVIGEELNVFWKTKPRTMLKKVVICQGFRLAFPDEMGGMPYAPEEINVEILDTTPIRTGKPEVADPEEKIPDDVEAFNAIPSASEEIPEPSKQAPEPPKETPPAPKLNDKGEKLASDKQTLFISNLLMHWKDGSMKDGILKTYKIQLFNELTSKQASECIKILQDKIAKEKANGK